MASGMKRWREIETEQQMDRCFVRWQERGTKRQRERRTEKRGSLEIKKDEDAERE